MMKSISDLLKTDKKCVICDSKIYGKGNSSFPYTKSGICCDKCFADKVLPLRKKEKTVQDSIEDLTALIESEKEAIDLYTLAINNANEGLERDIYTEILADEKDHLEKLNDLLEGYNKAVKVQ